MTTETVKIPTQEELLETTSESVETTTTEVEYSEAEQRAMEDGWVPKDQWKGNPDEWRPAKEFNDRGELFSRIKAQSKELAELKAGMEFLTKEAKKQYDLGVKNTIEELKQARRAALEDGNIVAAEEFRDKIDEVKEEAAKVKVEPPKAPAGPSPVFESWHDRNPWYMKDDELTDLADVKGKKYMKANPDCKESEMLSYVTEEVKKAFPNKFVKSPPSPSGGGRESPRGRSESAGGLKDVEAGMSEEHRAIMKTIIKTTGMTKEEYLKQYAS